MEQQMTASEAVLNALESPVCATLDEVEGRTFYVGWRIKNATASGSVGMGDWTKAESEDIASEMRIMRPECDVWVSNVREGSV